MSEAGGASFLQHVIQGLKPARSAPKLIYFVADDVILFA